MTSEAAGAPEAAPLVQGMVSLIVELGGGAAPDAEAAVRQALLTVPSSEGEAPEGELTDADVLRIRLSKLLARVVPPACLQDPTARRRARRRIRELVAAHLGDDRSSRFLDGWGGRS